MKSQRLNTKQNLTLEVLPGGCSDSRIKPLPVALRIHTPGVNWFRVAQKFSATTANVDNQTKSPNNYAL
jgi:hypothetical protein